MEKNEAPVRPRVLVFDTTLRDGEQAPGCSMNLGEKLVVAAQLERLGVDVIEAGFPVASPDDAAAVREIARKVRRPVIAALSRASQGDILTAWESLKGAERPRIHTFIATSPVHMEYKLKMGPDELVERAVEAVRYARSLCPDVEFSAEDGSRSDPAFLCRIFSAVIAAGATTINLPDTVGYATPGEFADLVRLVRAGVPEIGRAVLSVHCHDDLGLAVANSLAAVEAGAEQVECTINGLGERAGNAALEEVVMALRTRADRFGRDCGVDSSQIYGTSRLVATTTGVRVQPNKAVVGDNAFAHESGIHQHGVLANSSTYEIMTPESVGLPRNKMVLGKHSGRHAFEERLVELGFNPPPEEVAVLFAEFKSLADRKKTVGDRDLEALARGKTMAPPETWKLDRFVINSGIGLTATSAVSLVHCDGTRKEGVAGGDGPIDASFNAIDSILGMDPTLEDFSLSAVTGGKDAQGEARVRIVREGRRFNGLGLSTDVIEASVRAYVAAINALVHETGGTACAG